MTENQFVIGDITIPIGDIWKEIIHQKRRPHKDRSRYNF